MKKIAVIAAMLAAGACGPSLEVQKAPGAPAAAANANLAVSSYEVIEKAEDEGQAYLKVFVDGNPAGQTAAGPKSRDKTWEGALPAGNHPIRLEYWVMTSTSDWSRLPEEYQPHERFMRLEDGIKTKVTVKFFDQARRNSVTSSKEPMGRTR